MQRADIRSTLIVMLGLAAASLMGFMRQVMLANQMGSSRATDIYLIAFSLPEFIFVALPIVLVPALLPPLIACRKQAGEATALKVGKSVAGMLLILLTIFAFVVGFGAPVYMPWLAKGFDAIERARAIHDTHLMLLSIIFMGMAILGGAILQAYRRFARPAFTTAVYNLTFMVGLFALPVMPLEDRAAWAVTLGAFIALALQWPVWRSFFSSMRLEANDQLEIKSPGPSTWTKHVAGLAGPLALGYTAHHLILVIDRAMATTLSPGSVAALDYALRLAQVIGQIGGLAISTVLFPRLVENLASKNTTEARRCLIDALRLVYTITLPACLGLIVLRAPLVRAVFERGAFDQAATTMVSGALVWYALAVLADAMCQPLWRVIYAQQRVWTVLAVNGFQTGVRVLCNIIFIGHFGYKGIALSAVLGLSIQAAVLGLLVHRRLAFLPRFSEWREVGTVTLASLLAAGIAYILVSRLSANNDFVSLLVSGGAGGIFYVAVLLCLRIIRKRENWLSTIE